MGLSCAGIDVPTGPTGEPFTCRSNADCPAHTMGTWCHMGAGLCVLNYCREDCDPEGKSEGEFAGCNDPANVCNNRYSDVLGSPRPGVCANECDVFGEDTCVAYPTEDDTRYCRPRYAQNVPSQGNTTADPNDWNNGTCFRKTVDETLAVGDECELDNNGTLVDPCPVGSACFSDGEDDPARCIAVCTCDSGKFVDGACVSAQCGTGEVCGQVSPLNDRLGSCIDEPGTGEGGAGGEGGDETGAGGEGGDETGGDDEIDA
jgi:hypothetical protein